MQIKYSIRGVEVWEAFLKTLPHGVVRVAMSAIADYIIGDGRHGLKHYSMYKYVKRAAAYGKPFESDKQRRWFFAALSRGEINPGYPRRTGKTQRGYVKVVQNNGYRVLIENKEPGAVYTRHDTLQAKLNAMGGWLKQSAVIANNMAGAIRHATAEVWKYLRSR